MVNRRAFLYGFIAALAAPPAAEAQETGKARRIGYLGVAPRPPDEAFKRGLREAGYTDGQNLIVEYRLGTCQGLETGSHGHRASPRPYE